MLIVNRLGEEAGRYYVPGPVTGRWCGGGRQDLGLDGRVTARALAAVLRGRHPDTGDVLSPRRQPNRRAGTDLIFTAPKSVSLLAALAPDGDVVARAHLRACADAFVWLENHGCWARRGGGLTSTSGFVGARFSHHLSAAGEPHLHTHVLVANVVRAGDDRWSALDGGGLWLNRRAVAAAYHLGLRQQLLAAGLRPRWAIRPDGTADLADVPLPAIEATSSRRTQIQARRSGDDPAPRKLTAAQRMTREQAGESRTWVERATAAGFGAEQAGAIIDDARQRAHSTLGVDAVGPDRLSAEVVDWLDRRRSTFGLPDVMQGLAATCAEGASAVDAHRWARTFLDASPQSGDGRHTSRLSASRDSALADSAVARTATGRVNVGADRSQTETSPPAVLRTLLDRSHGVEVLGRPRVGGAAWPVTRQWGGFVAQAGAIDEARAAWQAAGHTVAVDAPSGGAAQRWRALTGIPRHLAGDPPPGVLVVDRADRRTTSELRDVLDRAASAGTQVVLVAGGTLPARRVAISQGLEQMADRLGRVAPDADLSSDIRQSPSPMRAFDAVVRAWSDDRLGPTTMVALGPAECDELNHRARLLLRDGGALSGAEVMIAGRPYAVGDHVITTRRGALPAGTRGSVGRVDPAGSLVVETDAGPLTVDRRAGRALRHAYSVTPGMLRFDAGPLVLLGRPTDLGRHAGRVIDAHAVEPDIGAGLRPSGDDRSRAGTSREVGRRAHRSMTPSDGCWLVQPAPPDGDRTPDPRRAGPPSDDRTPDPRRAGPPSDDRTPDRERAGPLSDDLAPDRERAGPLSDDLAPDRERAGPPSDGHAVEGVTVPAWPRQDRTVERDRDRDRQPDLGLGL